MSTSHLPVCPRISATARTSAPSARAARATFSPLPPATSHEARRAVDVAPHQPVDLEQLVDRRVRGQADDHAAVPRSMRLEHLVHRGLAVGAARRRAWRARRTRCRSPGSARAACPPATPARNPASNESPAPVVSTTRPGMPATCGRLAGRGEPTRAVGARSSPRPSTPARGAAATASSRSEMCASCIASMRVRQEDVDPGAAGRAARRPTSRSGPSSGRPRCVRPGRVRRVEERGQIRRERPLQEVGADVHVARRARAAAGSISSARRSPIVPGAVSIARSSGAESTTVSPGRPARDRRRARAMSTPRRASCSRMKRAEQVVADDARERHPQAEPRGAAREDRARTADREGRVARRAARPARTPARRRRRAAPGRGSRRRAPAGRSPPWRSGAYLARRAPSVRSPWRWLRPPRSTLDRLGDITRQDVDAIVNAANTGAAARRRRRRRDHARRGTGGARRAGARSSPSGVTRRCRPARRWRRPAASSRARWIIHTAGPSTRAATRSGRLLATCHTVVPARGRRARRGDRRVPRDLDRRLRVPGRRGGAGRDRRACCSADTQVEQVRFVLFASPTTRRSSVRPSTRRAAH